MAGMRLSTLRIAHTGEGVPLTVVSASCALAAMDPAYWPARGVLIAKPPVPFYLEPMAVGLR